MQVISEVGPCVGRDVSFSRNFEKVHVLKGSDYLVGAKLLPSAVDLQGSFSIAYIAQLQLQSRFLTLLHTGNCFRTDILLYL